MVADVRRGERRESPLRRSQSGRIFCTDNERGERREHPAARRFPGRFRAKADPSFNCPHSPFKGRIRRRIVGTYVLQNIIEIHERLLRIYDLLYGPVLCEDRLHLRVACKSPFARRLQTSIDALELLSRGGIYATTQFRIDLERDLSELALCLFWPSRRALQYFFKDSCCHMNNIQFTGPTIKSCPPTG